MRDVELFEIIAEDSPDGLVLVGNDGLIRFWNRTAEAMFGHRREEAVGQRLHRLILQAEDDDRPMASEFGDRPGVSFDAVARSGTGALLYINVASRRLRSDGKPIGELYSLADVTQLRTRRDAQLLQARYRNLLDSMPDAVVVVNEIGRIALVNRQAEHMFGYGPDELVGAPLETMMPERYRAGHWRHRERYMNRPHTRPMGEGLELYGQRNGGEEFPVEISLSPLRTDVGQFALSAIRDISERRRVERVLEEKNLELERANQAKDRFLAAMSHELRTPLNAIIGFTGILLMRLPGPLTTDQEKQLTMVQSSGKHLLSLINDLLDLAKIDAAGALMRVVPLDCSALIEEVATTLRPAASAKGLQLATNVAQDAWVMADRRALQQITINLANNAIKFTQRGAIEMFVESAGNGLWAIGVSDTGVGMSADEVAQLFQPFTQVGLASQRASSEGTGLGLYLCRKLAELQQSSIEVRSHPGVGSRFWFVLPAVEPQRNGVVEPT
ncbi:MAG TPA: PAS domain S-box protein [Ideonella sp.]|uniref:PAS domain-containing sensor histidine kinase n=1 Tax=Ideonella sp. TaxID=1929293 RepID=UPI002E36E03E|nr:PAS domain S-box protein [Ideonella sp.]HEX5685896.1 PAS domain S-box protein [Ideonella sp.]